jgi:hypothetical protein
MTAPITLALLPAAPWRRAAFAAGDPSRAPLPPTPRAEEDEDFSLAGLLGAAREHATDWLRLFGDPADLLDPAPAPEPGIAAAPTRKDPDPGLLRGWTRNLAWIVRHLVLLAALAMGPLVRPSFRPSARPSSSPSQGSPATTTTLSAEGVPAFRAAAARTLAIAIAVAPRGPDDASAEPLLPMSGDGNLPSGLGRAWPDEAARCASLFLRIAATLDRFDLCARRLAARFARLDLAPSAGAIGPADPPPTVRAGGRYNPLSRLAQLIFALLQAELERPLAPADG